MISLENIMEAYFVARRNKRRSPDQVEFELHWERNCLKLYEDVTNRCVKPTAYTFITDFPKPREVFASDMGTRILHHYLDIRLRPLLEKRMSPHTFNNRVGMGQKACQEALAKDIAEVTENYTKDAYIAKVDLSGCFPNIDQRIAYAQLKEVINKDYEGDDKEDLAYILGVCVFSDPAHHCYRKSRIEKWEKIPPEKSLFNKPPFIGAAIGHLIWQNAVNYYFHEIDEWLIENNIKFERFVDDFVFVIPDKKFLEMIPELRERLSKLGARLNENKFYCQHYTKGVEWLGVHMKKDRVHPNRRITNRGVVRAKSLNRHISMKNVDTVLASINSYTGICKNVNGYKQAKRIIKKLSPKWEKYISFNRERVCMQAHPEYSYRNRIIGRFNLVGEYQMMMSSGPLFKG